MKLKSFLIGLVLISITSICQATVSLEQLSEQMNVGLTQLQQAVKLAKKQNKIIDAMNRPSESKPWWQYRKIFITTSRIEAGIKFYLDNQATLKRAAQVYGVPEEIICSIIGVETFYGKQMGSWKVLDALYTLGFHYPKRESYFSKEFANFVKLAKNQNWELTTPQGSYAGAMGMGQFMPSSYLDYAVDFNQDGQINLFTSTEDAIGSVANYFKKKGWHTGEGIYYAAHLNHADEQALLNQKWDLSSEAFYQSGASTKVNLTPQKIRFFSWPLEDGTTGYGVGLHNFNVIMRYNTSPLYARAVYELSIFIKKGVHEALAANKDHK